MSCKSGVYVIELFGVRGKRGRYVGSTNNFKRRWGHHVSALRHGSHGNKHLQNAWHKYGEKHFRFSVLEEVRSLDDLFHREQAWINELDPEYNVSRTAGPCSSEEHDNSGWEVQEPDIPTPPWDPIKSVLRAQHLRDYDFSRIHRGDRVPPSLFYDGTYLLDSNYERTF